MTDAGGLAGLGAGVIVAKGAMDLADVVLRPPLAEAGEYLRECILHARMNNWKQLLSRASKILDELRADPNLRPNLRLMAEIANGGTWADEPELEEMWSGLLASSCSGDGRDESNLMFVNILKQLTRGQAKLLQKACDITPKTKLPNGIVAVSFYASRHYPRVKQNDLLDIWKTDDLSTVDREIDHLIALSLIQGGIQITRSGDAEICATPLCFHLIARCHGWTGPLEEFFTLE
ncbi:MAG TPA: Abi-alpha family protein [Planctomycetaceae bacterium]|nr:Abi-alpha family protein [Planctomycetaceae bacterium]